MPLSGPRTTDVSKTYSSIPLRQHRRKPWLVRLLERWSIEIALNFYEPWEKALIVLLIVSLIGYTAWQTFLFVDGYREIFYS